MVMAGERQSVARSNADRWAELCYICRVNDAPQTFEEFWPYYVSQHLNATCRRLHFIGTTLSLAVLVASVWQPWLLLAIAIPGYGFAWIGHFAFEKNKPASWFSVKHAVWSFRGDMRMYRQMCLGRMDAELARVAS
jgi:hypothetical protein